MHGPTQVALLWILTILWKSSYCVWHWGRWLIPASKSSTRAPRSQRLYGRVWNPWTFPPPLTSFYFIKYVKKTNNPLSIWDRKAKRQPRMKHLEVEYKALRISGHSRNAGKPWRPARFPSLNDFAVVIKKTTVPATRLAPSLQKRPSRRRNALLNTPLIQRGVCLDLLTWSLGNIGRDFPNPRRTSASTCKGASPPFGFSQPRSPCAELKTRRVCCCWYFSFVFCLLTDICYHAKQVFLCKRTCPVCVSPSSLLRTQMSSMIKNPVNFWKETDGCPTRT